MNPFQKGKVTLWRKGISKRILLLFVIFLFDSAQNQTTTTARSEPALQSGKPATSILLNNDDDGQTTTTRLFYPWKRISCHPNQNCTKLTSQQSGRIHMNSFANLSSRKQNKTLFEQNIDFSLLVEPFVLEIYLDSSVWLIKIDDRSVPMWWWTRPGSLKNTNWFSIISLKLEDKFVQLSQPHCSWDYLE